MVASQEAGAMHPTIAGGIPMLVGKTVAEKEFAMLDQGEQRFRTWANR
jgi:hypothetical protein